MTEKIYFGRPIDTFGQSELEIRLKSAIKLFFQNDFGVEIIDPSEQEHQDGYWRYRENGKSGMDYYLIEVLPRVDLGIFLPFEDGKIGAGVWLEADFLRERGKKIFEINRRGDILPLNLAIDRKLDIEETRRRVGKQD